MPRSRWTWRHLPEGDGQGAQPALPFGRRHGRRSPPLPRRLHHRGTAGLSRRQADPLGQTQRAVAASLLCAAVLGLVAAAFAWQAYQAWKEIRTVKLQRAIDDVILAAWSGDVDQAETKNEEARRLGATPGWTLMLRGQVAFHRGETADAVAALQTAVELLPHSPAARGMLAVAYWQDGKWEECEKTLADLTGLEAGPTGGLPVPGLRTSRHRSPGRLGLSDAAISKRSIGPSPMPWRRKSAAGWPKTSPIRSSSSKPGKTRRWSRRCWGTSASPSGLGQPVCECWSPLRSTRISSTSEERPWRRPIRIPESGIPARFRDPDGRYSCAIATGVHGQGRLGATGNGPRSGPGQQCWPATFYGVGPVPRGPRPGLPRSAAGAGRSPAPPARCLAGNGSPVHSDRDAGRCPTGAPGVPGGSGRYQGTSLMFQHSLLYLLGRPADAQAALSRDVAARAVGQAAPGIVCQNPGLQSRGDRCEQLLAAVPDRPTISATLTTFWRCPGWPSRSRRCPHTLPRLRANGLLRL